MIAICLLGFPGEGGAMPQQSVVAAQEQAAMQMDVMMFRIKMFHREVKSTLLGIMELPFFKEYFSLQESANNSLDSMGVMQFSPNQIKLRQKIEAWALILHKKFPIGEACLIDRQGQEHLRMVQGKLEDSQFFSADESDSPFFKATFALKEGEVFTSEPYMSPDSMHWVTAYTAPVVLDTGDKPAFFHFEIPLDVYGKLISTVDYSYSMAHQAAKADKDEEGRFFIVNKDGLVVADSRNQISFELKKAANPDADFRPGEKLVDYLPKFASIMTDSKFQEAITRLREAKSGMVQLSLKDHDYILLFQPIPGSSWTLVHLDPVGGKGFWEKKD
ncbi:MAG: cache domain-containing protein [Magnetococcales bacterium]|nr:cache domain-containing protein [Magnetococcales bacterium]